jgi:hypothetical protein
MELTFLVVLAGMTSSGAYLILRLTGRWSAKLLLAGIYELLDWAGLFAVFVTANLALGLMIILLIRVATSQFVSVYQLESLLLLILSAAQAFVFHRWWKRS